MFCTRFRKLLIRVRDGFATAAAVNLLSVHRQARSRSDGPARKQPKTLSMRARSRLGHGPRSPRTSPRPNYAALRGAQASYRHTSPVSDGSPKRAPPAPSRAGPKHRTPARASNETAALPQTLFQRAASPRSGYRVSGRHKPGKARTTATDPGPPYEAAPCANPVKTGR